MSKNEEKTVKEPKYKEKMNVSLKPLSILFFCAVIVTSALRALQMAKYIDPETGFYTGGEAVKYTLYAIITIAAIVFFVISYFSSDSGKISFYKTKNQTIGFVSAVMAFTFFYDSFSSFGNSVTSVYGSNSANYASFMASGTIPSLLQSAFALMSALFFLIFAKDMIKGTDTSSNRKILATMPVWWAGSRLVGGFVRQISFMEVSDLFLELLMLACMLIFFMALAQVITGVYSDGFRWRIVGFGYAGAFLALTLSLPRLIFSFVSDGAFINSSYPFNLSDLVFAFFALTIILCHKPVSNDRNMQNEQVESENKGE